MKIATAHVQQEMRQMKTTTTKKKKSTKHKNDSDARIKELYHMENK